MWDKAQSGNKTRVRVSSQTIDTSRHFSLCISSEKTTTNPVAELDGNFRNCSQPQEHERVSPVHMDKLSVTCTHLDALFCRCCFVVVLVASSPCHMSPQSISDTTIPEMQKWPVHGLSLFNMADSLKYQLFWALQSKFGWNPERLPASIRFANLFRYLSSPTID